MYLWIYGVFHVFTDTSVRPEFIYWAFEICHSSSPLTFPLVSLLCSNSTSSCVHISIAADWLHEDSAGSWSVARGDLVRFCLSLTSRGASGELRHTVTCQQMELNFRRCCHFNCCCCGSQKRDTCSMLGLRSARPCDVLDAPPAPRASEKHFWAHLLFKHA